MNKLLPGFFAVLVFVAATGCKKNSVPVSSTPDTTALKVNVQNIGFTNFTSKGRMQLETADNNVASNVTIRIKKDSVIWVSVVPGLGIEAARVFITPDTIMIINRLQREFYAGSFSLLKKRYNIAASFDLLQGILTGNYVPGLPGTEKELSGGELQQYRQTRTNMQVDQFLDPTQRKLKRIHITDTQTKDALNVTYNEFEPLDNKPFPTAFLMLLDRVSATNPKAKNASVAVKYSKFSINEAGMEFPFSVPADYQRK